MSRGQKPRQPEFFPHMRYRARKRHMAGGWTRRDVKLAQDWGILAWGTNDVKLEATG